VSELERAEQAVYAHEQEVAELERRLAEDWTDAEAVAAHARARENLKAALARWEELFEHSQT
jgi:quinol monooxygenase YgiN